MTFEQHKRLVIVLLLAIVLALVLMGPNNKKDEDAAALVIASGIDIPTTTLDTLDQEEVSARWPIDLFAQDPRIEGIQAEAVYVYWIDEDQVVYDKNAGTPLPLASLTKIMTAHTALLGLDGSETITMTLDALRQGGDQGFIDGQQFSLQEAVAFMMVTSSNDMAYAVQESVARIDNGEAGGFGRGAAVNSFVRKMNEQAVGIGLSSTFFVDAVGFDDSESLSGSYGSASDVSRLMVSVSEDKPDLVAAASVQEVVTQGDRSFGNTNPLVRTENLLFSKTGYTDLAGGNLAVIAGTDVGSVAIVVMGSTFDERFSDVESLIRIFEDWIGNFGDAN